MIIGQYRPTSDNRKFLDCRWNKYPTYSDSNCDVSLCIGVDIDLEARVYRRTRYFLVNQIEGFVDFDGVEYCGLVDVETVQRRNG